MGCLLEARIIYQVVFVGHNYYLNLFLRVSVHFFQPIIQVYEAFTLEQVKYENDSMSILVICACDCSVSLLACCIPNLQFDCLIFNFDSSEPKVDTNGTNVRLGERVICKSKKKASILSA